MAYLPHSLSPILRAALPLCIAIATVLLGCSGGRKAQRVNRPAEFQLSLSKGGGFSGLRVGYEVFSQGDVFRWRGVVRPDSLERLGQVPPAALDSIWILLENASLFGREDDERGNLTGQLRLAVADSAVSLSWKANMPPQPAEGDLESLYRQILSVISGHLNV
jgi:hypothetical protein